MMVRNLKSLYVSSSLAHINRSQRESAVSSLPIGQRSHSLWQLRQNAKIMGPSQQSVYVIGQVFFFSFLHLCLWSCLHCQVVVKPVQIWQYHWCPVSPAQVWRLCLLAPAAMISCARSSASWADTLTRRSDSGTSGQWECLKSFWWACVKV